MLKKRIHNHYFYQTNPKKQPEKTPVHTEQSNNNQEEPDG